MKKKNPQHDFLEEVVQTEFTQTYGPVSSLKY